MNCFMTPLYKLFLAVPEAHQGDDAILENFLDHEVRTWNKTIPQKNSIQLVSWYIFKQGGQVFSRTGLAPGTPFHLIYSHAHSFIH